MPSLVIELFVKVAFVVANVAARYPLLAKIFTAVALNVVSSKLFGPKIPSSLKALGSHAVMRETAIQYRTLVYGQAATSGPIVYKNVSGTNREYLWYVIALCDGEIDDLVSVYFDGDVIPEADIAWSPGAGGADGSGTGDVSTAKFVGDNSTKAVQIYYAFGHDDQVVMSKIDTAFSDWTSSHRLRGIAYLVCRLLYNEDTEEVWQTGPPGNIKAVVKGTKVYDPRLDTTQVIDDTTSPLTYGVGAHRTATESTWTWSDNPALCVGHYLLSVMGVAAANIDWPSFADAADDCDTLVVTLPDTSPETTEKRFTCNGVITLGGSHKDNLDSLLSCFDGKLSYSSGVWKLRASVWEASSVTFTEDDLIDTIDVRGSAPKSERFNSIRGVFVDPSRKYEPAEFPHLVNSIYKTRDNEIEIMYDLELPMTNSVTEAQRVADRLLEQADNQIVCKIRTNVSGAKCTIGDVVSLTIDKLSWAAKTFRVIEWQRNPESTFDITLREDYSASYDDMTITDYTTGNTASVTLPSEVVPPPTGFSASSVPYAIRLNWTNPAFNEWDLIDVYASDTSAWSGAARIASVRTDTYTHNLGNGTAKYYWLRARRNNGDVSLRTPDSDTSTVTATAGSGTDSINLTGATLSDQQVAATTEVAYRLTSGGQEESYETVPPSPTVWDTISTWLIDGTNSNFESRLSKTSGTDPTSGNLATWEVLSSTRTWVWTDSTQDDSAVSFDGTIEIRDIAQSPAPVLASANVSLTIDSQNPSVVLSGTAGSPNASTVNQTEATATAGWRFNADGTVDRLVGINWTQFRAGTEWISPLPSPNIYWFRFTDDSGDTVNGGSLVSGTWYALTSARQITWIQSSAGIREGTARVDIATDSSPAAIVATGYYKGRAWYIV